MELATAEFIDKASVQLCYLTYWAPFGLDTGLLCEDRACLGHFQIELVEKFLSLTLQIIYVLVWQVDMQWPAKRTIETGDS